jgi:hypothetical protein
MGTLHHWNLNKEDYIANLINTPALLLDLTKPLTMSPTSRSVRSSNSRSIAGLSSSTTRDLNHHLLIL